MPLYLGNTPIGNVGVVVEGMTTKETVLQEKTVYPTEAVQSVTPDVGYDGLSGVEVGAIDPAYVGSAVVRKDAATITPGTEDQSVVAGTYLVGALTIKGDANLASENIIADKSIFGIPGGVVIQKYYTGTTEPDNSLGNDGDLYLMA
ncbi:MAG: hypothetical protein ACI3XJ_12715 [Oscillospiraceae bacterium]